MHELMSILAARMVDAAVAAAAVSGLAALAMTLARQPSRRRALARAGVIGALLVVPLVGLRPFAPLDLLAPLRLALEPWLGAGRPPWPRWLARALPLALMGLYAAGVVLGLGRIALGALGSVWIARNSRPASEEAQALYESLTAFHSGRPSLRVSERTNRPVLLGAIRPTILIPPDLDCDDPSGALRLALLHELAHAEASDPRFGLATELASALWFWLPPVRWIAGQVRLDQEFLADRHASARLGPSSAKYASTLVEIAATREAPRSAAGPGSRRGGTALLQRVLMLVRCPFPIEGRAPRWWRALLGLATAAALVLTTGLTLGARPHGPAPAAAHDLTIPRLVLEARRLDSPATALPLRLPDDFDLGFEVVASIADLARIEVLGHPLAGDGDAPLADVARTHRVALQRRGGALFLGLDGGPSLVIPGTSTDQWLTARGLSGVPITLRSVHLTW